MFPPIPVVSVLSLVEGFPKSGSVVKVEGPNYSSALTQHKIEELPLDK